MTIATRKLIKEHGSSFTQAERDTIWDCIRNGYEYEFELRCNKRLAEPLVIVNLCNMVGGVRRVVRITNNMVDHVYEASIGDDVHLVSGTAQIRKFLDGRW